jgi:Fic family protein
MIRKTSWSTEDLQMLTQVDNHKIMYDGYEYYWLRKLEDDWERHFILNFTNKKKAFHYLKYNIDKWQKELNVRLEKTVIADSYKQLERMLDTQEKTIKMANSSLPTIEKINHIKLIKEGISTEELSSLLKVKKSIIYRHIRTLKSRGTLFSA